MKKIIVTLAVLLLAAPAMADVTITCTPGDPCTDPNTVVVSFMSDEVGGLVRALALDIQVNDPCAWIEDVNCVSDYNIHPTNIVIGVGGSVEDLGSCAGVLDANLMISEQGSLYEKGVEDPPDQFGDLFIVTIGGCGEWGSDGNVGVTVSENVLRGGVVMEDANGPSGNVILIDAIVNIGECVAPCMLPICCPTCFGDLDTNCWVMVSDMFAMISLLTQKGTPYIIPLGDPLYNNCADMDNNGWIMTSDMFMIIAQLGAAGQPYMIPCPPPCP